jgi:hypothetical protein
MKLTQQVSFLVSDFMIKKPPCDLTSNAGLALVGQYVKRLGISGRADAKFAVGVGGIANSDILKRSLGLLVQGKNDFDAIEAFRQDDFFKRSLGIGAVPSSPTMRRVGVSLACGSGKYGSSAGAKREFQLRATTRESSRCCTWSSPTGTASAR